jgi:hypothetical protein
MCVNSLIVFGTKYNIHYHSDFKNDTKCIFSCLLFSQLTGPYSLSWFPFQGQTLSLFLHILAKKKTTNKHNSKTIQKLFLFRVLKSAQTWVTNPWILLLYTIDLSWNGEGFINYSANASCAYIYIYRSALLLDLHRLTACSWQYVHMMHGTLNID